MITQIALKLIAVITMFIDHLGMGMIMIAGVKDSDPAGWLVGLYMVMRGIGRTVFPIFCFLITEGFQHTYSSPLRSAWPS